MAAAIGSFGSRLPSFFGSQVLWQPTPKVLPFLPVAPQQPTTRPAPISTAPISRLPFTPPTIINTTPVLPPYNPGGTPVGSGPSTATPAGTTTGTQTGSTGTSDTSRLFDLIAASMAPQSITPGLSPTSVTDTSTVQPTTGTTSPLALLIVAIAIAGGIYWYMKHKKTAAT